MKRLNGFYNHGIPYLWAFCIVFVMLFLHSSPFLTVTSNPSRSNKGAARCRHREDLRCVVKVPRARIRRAESWQRLKGFSSQKKTSNWIPQNKTISCLRIWKIWTNTWNTDNWGLRLQMPPISKAFFGRDTWKKFHFNFNKFYHKQLDSGVVVRLDKHEPRIWHPTINPGSNKFRTLLIGKPGSKSYCSWQKMANNGSAMYTCKYRNDI